MKRFWKNARAVRTDKGWGVTLDDRPVKTPARADLTLPTEMLAEAVAAEWNGIGETIDPRTMPLTGLANAAIDRVAADPHAFAEGLAKYAEADLACYRADTPKALVDRQAEAWDALLGWARRRYDVDFAVTTGITHVRQPQATVERLAQAVNELDHWRLAGLSPLVTTGGSLVAALAVLEGGLSAEDTWEALTVDDRWQAEQWGSDADAEVALANRKGDFMAAARFLELVAA